MFYQLDTVMGGTLWKKMLHESQSIGVFDR